MSNKPKNFFVGNKYKFIITGERFKNNEFDVMITGLNIPGMQLGVINRGTTVKQIELPGDSISYNDLSIEFIISEDLTEWITIFEWLQELRNFSENKFNNDIVADANLILLTSKNNPNIALNFECLYPYNLSDIPLANTSTESEPVLGEVTFKYLNYKLIKKV